MQIEWVERGKKGFKVKLYRSSSEFYLSSLTPERWRCEARNEGRPNCEILTYEEWSIPGQRIDFHGRQYTRTVRRLQLAVVRGVRKNINQEVWDEILVGETFLLGKRRTVEMVIFGGPEAENRSKDVVFTRWRVVD